jgi:hypothetical protein
VVGVDECAKCKGRTYGTIVVDLEHHTVIDLLDQHSSESVEQWLSTHPEIQTICRDRNGPYGKAARKGTPAAKQVGQQFVGDGGDAIRAGHGQIWLSNYKSGMEWKLDSKAIAAIQP